MRNRFLVSPLVRIWFRMLKKKRSQSVHEEWQNRYLKKFDYFLIIECQKQCSNWRSQKRNSDEILRKNHHFFLGTSSPNPFDGALSVILAVKFGWNNLLTEWSEHVSLGNFFLASLSQQFCQYCHLTCPLPVQVFFFNELFLFPLHFSLALLASWTD